MNSEYLFWLVGFVTYLPLHLGLPLLGVLIRQGALPLGFKPWLLKGAMVTAVVFVLAYILSQYQLWWGFACIVLAMPLPWLALRELSKR